ncbi:MAG: MBL fold metallo-hydrolase [Clostridia bacterium]|nr:MBL fold metallo-hydrolase [Clostridia bacterium]
MKALYPIETPCKAKRIRFVNPINPVSWAYMKEMRENNRTRRIYDENPYVEVYQLREHVYGLFNLNLDGMGDVWCFLVVGPEKALLIDTAYGLGDNQALADRLTGGKPLYVVNTHHHCDHAFGNCRFDTVYCHEYLVPYLERQDEHIWDYLFDEKGQCKFVEFDRQDLPTFRKYRIEGVKNHHIFDLGGDHQIELIWTGGHAAGHAMFLDNKSRILFSGDNVCSDMCGIGSGPKKDFDPYGQFCNIETFRDQLQGIVERMEEFDYVFPSHFVLNLESRVLVDMLDTCNAILENPQDYDFLERRESAKVGGPVRIRMHKAVRGFSSIAYMEGGVYAPKG